MLWLSIDCAFFKKKKITFSSDEMNVSESLVVLLCFYLFLVELRHCELWHCKQQDTFEWKKKITCRHIVNIMVTDGFLILIISFDIIIFVLLLCTGDSRIEFVHSHFRSNKGKKAVTILNDPLQLRRKSLKISSISSYSMSSKNPYFRSLPFPSIH